MKLNLYQLCDKKHNKGSIKAILNDDLKNKIKEVIFKLRKQKIKFKDVSKQIGIDYTTLWKYLNKRNSISLTMLKDLEKLSKINFQDSIKKLEYGQGNFKVRYVDKINEDLAKIIGAIIADGHLRFRKSERGYHYELIIREEYKSNLDTFNKWFDKTFNLKLISKKKDNYYFIYISNKIIFKFLNSVIGIHSGRKTDIVSIPDTIKNSNLNIKKAFLQGIFMFDGGVDYRTGYVNLISKSKKLIEEIIQILKETKLEPDFISLKPDNFGRYKIRYRKTSKLKKCLQLFENNTEKWYRLWEHLYGLEDTTKDLKIVIKSFDSYYPKVRKNSITFSDVIKAVTKLNRADLNNVAKIIKKNKTVTYEFLRKLENWNVLQSQRVGLNKYYRLNSILNIPRR